MELVSIDLCRVTSLFAAQRPDKAPPLRAVIAAIGRRYAFQKGPSGDELAEDKFFFVDGVFNDQQVLGLEVYRDGVIAKAQMNSKTVDAFLTDLEEFMTAEYGYRRLETHKVNKSYESNLTLVAKPDILKALKAVAPICASLSKALHRATGANHEFQEFGFSLATDHINITTLKPVAFSVFKKGDLAFESNFFGSTAPLPTDDHMKLLKDLEKLL